MNEVAGTTPVLPSGWRWVQLGDLCREDRRVVVPGTSEAVGRPYLSLEHIESNTGRILRSPAEALSDEGKSNTFAFDERHILYGKLRPYLNKVALPAFAGRCTTELIPLLPTAETERGYLVWLLRRSETVQAAMQEKTGSRMPRADMNTVLSQLVPLPPLEEQQYIADALTAQMAAVEQARVAAAAQLAVAGDFVEACLHQSLTASTSVSIPLADALIEVSRGVGASWNEHEVLGATRAGIAPAKEGVGKSPQRYKRVDAATVFYNPMRILLGSIAMVDEGEAGGITSPDYVVLKTKPGMLHHRWFYYWLRSSYGEHFIKSLARGAVRERILFTRLATAAIEVPPWEEQQRCSEQLQAVPMLKQRIHEQQQMIEELAPSLLQQAFSGALSARRAVVVPFPVERLEERMALVTVAQLQAIKRRRTLVRTVAAKGLYFAAAFAGVLSGVTFGRWPFGPYYDGIREVEEYAAAKGWYTVHRNGERYEYAQGPAFDDALALVHAAFGEHADAMHHLLDAIALLDARQAEIVATLYAVWNDSRLAGKEPTDAEMFREVRDHWHPNKRKFSEDDLRWWLNRMRTLGLVPPEHGKGARTVMLNG